MDSTESKETTPTPPDSKKSGVQVFWMAFWLAVALIGAKLYHIRTPDNWGGREINRYVSDIAIVTAADLLFATGFGLVGWMLVLMCGNRRRWLKVTRKRPEEWSGGTSREWMFPRRQLRRLPSSRDAPRFSSGFLRENARFSDSLRRG